MSLPHRVGPAVVAVLLPLLLVAALASGCSGDDDEPGDIASPDPTPTTSASTTEATESPTESAGADPQAVVFYGGSGLSADGRCSGPAPTYVSLYEEFDVNQEVRFDEVTPAGGGALVGRVFVAPTAGRGPNESLLVVDKAPGLGRVDDIPEWRDRVPLPGQLVQPGAYVVFAQVKLVPGTRMDGLDFSYSDGDATGSSRLDVSAAVSKKCRD